MPFTEEEIATLLRTTSIVEAIQKHIPLHEVWIGKCPLNPEKHTYDPGLDTLIVDPNKGLYYCYWCQAAGNIFRFLMEKEQITFNEAVTLL